MATIKERVRFNYNGVWSDTYKLMNVNLDSGMFDETFVASRDIIETSVIGGNPLFHRIDSSPLEFDMTIAFKDSFNDADVDNVVKWLFQDNYKPLYFEGKENRVYHCIPVGDSRLVHTGLGKGYFTITMRCNSPYIYSQYITTTLETVSTNKTITISVDSHKDVYPEISIVKSGAGIVKIECLDDGGNVFEVKNLNNLEDIYVNCEKEIIQTNLLGTYRYKDITGNFPRLLNGSNRIKVTGACTIQFKYRNKYKY